MFRSCEEGADKAKIEQDIKTMPHYFADYETHVNFITEEELRAEHSKMPHGGFVIRSGKTGTGNKQIVEYSLKLESNPEFTASVLTAYARAAYRMNQAGQSGAKTVLDVPPGFVIAEIGCTAQKRIIIKSNEHKYENRRSIAGFHIFFAPKTFKRSKPFMC